MAYIELVVCKHPDCDKKYLFYAPAWTGLEKGDEVIVDTCNGEKSAVVLTKTIVEKGSEVYAFILESTGATLPLRRVLKLVEYRDIDYKEEN